MSSSAFVPTVLTIPGSTSTSSGEKNYVLAADGNATGLWVASGVTISTSTSTIPDNITRTTSLAISWVSGTTGYARYRFTLDQADYGKKFKIQWDQIYGTAGHWTLQVFSNTAADYSGTSTALTVQTSSIPGVTGTFTTSVDMPGLLASAPYIEIRIVAANTSATTLYLNAILVGPGTITQGAVISEWQSYTPVLTNITIGNGTLSGRYRRVGSNIEGNINVVSGTTTTYTSTDWEFGIPSDLTYLAPGNNTVETVVGTAIGQINDGADNEQRNGFATFIAGTSTRFKIKRADALTNASANYWNSTTTGAVNNLNFTRLSIWFSFPVNEFSGSGTVNLGPGAQQEFAFNSSATTTSDTTSFAAGPAGAAFTAMVPTGNNSIEKRVRFQYPIQDDDILVLEVNNTNGWQQMSDALGPFSGNDAGTTNYGQIIRRVAGSTTDVSVSFFSATAGQSSWGGLSTWKWRVRKAKASSPVGFGLVSSANGAGLMPSVTSQLDNATATQLGLKQYLHGTTYNGGIAPTVTSAQSGFTVLRALFVPQQTQDGTWRVKFNLNVTFTVATITNITITINGITFKNITNFYQAIVSYFGNSGTAVGTSYVNPNASTISIYLTASSSQQEIRITGDVELESKPTWAY